MSVKESPAEAWVAGDLLHGVGALSVAVHAWDLLKEVTITLITSTIVSLQFSRSVMSDSAARWTAAHQASLSMTNSQSYLKLMSIE